MTGRIAPKGKIWVCMACGKFQLTDRYGAEDGSSGWDESCMLNSELFDVDSIVWNDDSSRVVQIL